MTELLDPCEELEVTEPERDEGPSVLPLTPDDPQPVEAAFPIRRFQEVESSTIRESSLINQQNFNLPSVKGKIRYPVDVLAMNNLSENYVIDPFKYSAGKFFLFQGGGLKFSNKGFRSDVGAGMFYDIKINSRMLGSTEKNDISLIVNDNNLTKLKNVDNRYPTSNEKFVEAYFLGSRDDATINWPAIATPGIGYSDNSFTCPAAFFENEASSNTMVNVKDMVNISVHVGNLNTLESNQEITKTSLYRHYKSQTLENYPTSVPEDVKQKFSCDNIQDFKTINQLTTNHFNQSPLYNSSQAILNNHIKISITSNHDSNISGFFKELSLDTYLLDYIDYYSSSSAPLYAQILDQNVFGGIGNNSAVLDYQPNQYSYDDFIGNEYSVNDMIEESKSETKDYPLSYSDSLNIFNSETSESPVTIDFILYHRKQALKSKIKTFIANKKRSFADILSGKKCFSQVIAYRVEKRDVSTKEVIQNFYFFNDPDTDEIEFIDTQLVYQKRYEYSIYAINFVVGNSYTYFNKNEEYIHGDFSPIPIIYDFTVNNLTKIFFIETPYFRQQVKMIDKPPVFPEVEVLPFFEEDNRISFRLTPRLGDVKEDPISILQSDRQTIIDMLLANPELEGSVHYSSDTLPSQYQMLIMEKAPEEYSDFSNAQSIIVDASYNSGFIEVNVEPNKKYYITFRAIDPAGISNPGPVYKFSINSYANGIFVDYDEYEMKEIINETPIEFQRSFSLEPSFKQSSIKFDSLQENNLNFYQSAPSSDTYSIGLDNENRIWGRKFKIRIVSKATSKAIDLNIKFKEFYKTLTIDDSMENVAPPESEELEATSTGASTDSTDSTDSASSTDSTSAADPAAAAGRLGQEALERSRREGLRVSGGQSTGVPIPGSY